MEKTVEVSKINLVEARSEARKRRAADYNNRQRVAMEFPHLWTVDECCTYLRKTRRYVERLIQTGKLEALDVGQGDRHSWLVPFESLLNFTGKLPLTLSQVGELILQDKDLMEIVVKSVTERISRNVATLMRESFDRLN